jgi:hypothetical protein
MFDSSARWDSWRDKFPCLRSFYYAARNLSCVNLKSVIANILPHSGHKYYILDIHPASLVQVKRRSPFTKLRQGRNHPVIDRIGTRE